MTEIQEQENQMSDYPRPPGKTTIAPEVLLTIVRLTALKVDGVCELSTVPGGVNRFFRRGYGDGLRIEIEDDPVYADLYVVLDNNVNIRQVSRQVQKDVARAISEMVGMRVGRINIHIEDIDYPELPSANSMKEIPS
jgi:uncharacterized alkaline shock family protein YloU